MTSRDDATRANVSYNVCRHVEAHEGMCHRVKEWIDLGGVWKHVEIQPRLTVVRGNT